MRAIGDVPVQADKDVDDGRRRLVAGLAAISAGWGWWPVQAGPVGAAKPARAEQGGRPNILFILADDMGWGDLGCYGQTDFTTPVLDAMARQGLRMTQAYANSCVCSATRIALATGRYQYRFAAGLEEPLAGGRKHLGLPPEEATLASRLTAEGYATALIGKWHMGWLPAFGPLKSGYERFFGNVSGGIDYFTHKASAAADAPTDLYEGETPVDRQGYYTDILTDEAVAYVRGRGKGGADARPFFLSLHYTAPHWPWEGPGDEARSKALSNLGDYSGGSLQTYADMLRSMDEGIGRVLAALDEAGLSDNTIVVFTSDNGGERFSRTWPLTGQKTELLEGGIRVPQLVRWPGRIPAGSVSGQVMMSMDWVPTLLSACGAPIPPDGSLDGQNLLPQLMGREAPRNRTLFWRYKAHTQAAMRQGDWKYLRLAGQEFLFNLAQDVRERANKAGEQPALLARMKAEWQAWSDTMLPLDPASYTHRITPEGQADRYTNPPSKR